MLSYFLSNLLLGNYHSDFDLPIHLKEQNYLVQKNNLIPAAKILTMEDFYPKTKKWKKLDTWNKYDSSRVDELLYNGGDISEAFYNNVYEKQDYEKSKKMKNKWGKKS